MKKLAIAVFFFPLVFSLPAWSSTVTLEPLTGSPGSYRWLDVADQAYSTSYQTGYNYGQANVSATFENTGSAFSGTLSASNLKPNFAYQLKLAGTPGTPSNELIGLTGRWWQEEWNGSAWANGQNLNNKGDGSSPNPNDAVYFSRWDITDSTSPTGLNYRYTGYLVFDYFITDANGSATLSFATDSSYHVLWKTTQRAHGASDGPLKSTTFDTGSTSPGYDTDYPSQTVTVYGEWERLPVDGTYLPSGDYSAELILTEESFHGSGGTKAGNWAAAMGADVNFTVVPIPSTALLLGAGLVALVGVRRKRP